MSAWYMCDQDPGEWCDDCFALHPCGQGKHGEGCPTVVFDDEIALVAGAEAVIKALELAESIIADMGLHWAVVAATAEAETTDDPEAISTIRSWLEERKEARA